MHRLSNNVIFNNISPPISILFDRFNLAYTVTVLYVNKYHKMD